MHNYGLVEALIVAHQKRLQKNNSVFLLSNTPFREVLPGINVIRLDALDKAFGKKPFRGIFLDSPSLSVESAQRIKKSLRNTVVPIGLYGTENEAAWVLSDLATDVYRETESLEKCIQQFADASGNFLFRALMTSRLKSAQTDGRNKDTLQISQELETLQPRCSLSFSYRGHALEKMNLKEEAIEAYLKAIEVNPFHPENYLRLIEIVPNSDSILLKAKQYCPRHPQIVSQLKLHELKISSLK
jgi:tetratricopeptide (TPR) repeat protein